MKRNETFVSHLKERFLGYPCDAEVFHIPGQRSYRETSRRLYYENFFPLASCSTTTTATPTNTTQSSSDSRWSADLMGGIIKQTCETLTTNLNTSLLRISLSSPTLETETHSHRWCTSRVLDILLIPFLQYLPSNTTLMLSSGLNRSAAAWDIAVRYTTFGSKEFTEKAQQEVGDMFYLDDFHPLDMLSHAQVRLDGTHTSFSLLGILFTYLCPRSTIYSNVLSILCILFCLFDKWLTNQKRDLSRVNPILVTDHRQTVAYPKPKLSSFLIIKTVIELFDDAAQYVFAWVSLFCRHGEAFHQEFAEPLFGGLRRARRKLRRLSRTALLYLTMAIIIWGGLSSIIFEGELHSYLITAPLIYLNTAADFLLYRPQYNLTFGSLALSLNSSFQLGLIDLKLDAALTEIAQLYDAFTRSNINEILEKSAQTHWVINTGTRGCEAVRLSDPEWYAKVYHCMQQRSAASWKSVIIGSDFMGHPLQLIVTQLFRHIQEGSLWLRILWRENERFHAAGMQPGNFEPHAPRQVPPVHLEGMANLFISIAIILSHCEDQITLHS